MLDVVAFALDPARSAPAPRRRPRGAPRTAAGNAGRRDPPARALGVRDARDPPAHTPARPPERRVAPAPGRPGARPRGRLSALAARPDVPRRSRSRSPRSVSSPSLRPCRSRSTTPRRPTSRSPTDVPVVLVVFDELPVSSLLTAAGEIDGVRYPAFGRLAREATWYPRATTPHDYTTQAVPSLLTGRLPRRGELPTLADHPENLFTLLGDAYDLHVQEQVTHLCPSRSCPSTRSEVPLLDRQRGLFYDASAGYLHRTLPRAPAHGAASDRRALGRVRRRRRAGRQGARARCAQRQGVRDRGGARRGPQARRVRAVPRGGRRGRAAGARCTSSTRSCRTARGGTSPPDVGTATRRRSRGSTGTGRPGHSGPSSCGSRSSATCSSSATRTDSSEGSSSGSTARASGTRAS